MYALHITAGETDLLRLDPQGQVVWRKQQITDGLVKKTDISRVERLAVDGLGNIFLLDTYNSQVYRFDADGEYVDRFGSKGREAGQIEHPMDLAIDGQGRVFIIDSGSIDIFDSSGLFIESIPWDYSVGSPFDLKFDLEQKLFVITNLGQALKYRMNLE
jgi:streptogramin lyase